MPRARATMPSVIAAIALGLAAGAARAADNSFGYRLAGLYQAPNTDGLFFIEPARRYGLQEAFVRYAHEGFFLYGTAYNETRDGATPHAQGVLNEFYFDTKRGDWDFTLGKKRIEWGVGFGFRPLDVIKPLARRELVPLTPVGLPLISAERYTGSDAWTFLVGNDFGHNDEGFQSGDTETAARYFTLINGWDVQALVHTSSEVDYETGAAFSWTTGEEFELHGSALYQRHYRKWINTLTETGGVLATEDPLVRREFDHGIKALAGGTYTWRSGHALLFEYWFDEVGYTKQERDALRTLTQTQRALRDAGLAPVSAVNANITASTRVFAQPNLMQHNLLLRWSFDNGDRFVPALDALYTPQDGGLAVTASATQDIGTTYNLAYGARAYGGASDSIYRALPYHYIAFLSLKATFNW